MMRKQFLKEHRSARYQRSGTDRETDGAFKQVDKEAREKVEILMEQMVEQWGSDRRTEDAGSGGMGEEDE